MGKWLYYSVAAGSVHTKKFYSILYLTEIEFYLKNKESVFDPPFVALRGNVRTPFIASWKAGERLIFVMIILLRYILRLSRYKRKSVEVCVF